MAMRELPETDCPLMRNSPELRTRFNQLAEQLNEIEVSDPRFFATRDLQAMASEAGELRELLRRPRYQVGFLGLYQVGKSRTLNRVLRADAANRPVFEGQTGTATTATVTRVRSIPSGSNALTLRYLTRSDYETRRDRVIERLSERCAVEPGTEGDVLGQIPGCLEEARRGRDSFLELNLGYLQRLLNAYQRYQGEVLRDEESLEIAGRPYERRWSYINHSGRGNDDPTAPLLRDVVIDYSTEVVPREVELIDMPGLGTGWVLDDLLTYQLLEEVNGALLFYQVTKDVDSEQLADVLMKLRRRFPDGLRGRVWLVFTMCDQLTEFHFADAERNIFAGISTFLRQRDMSPEQIVFVCNQWDGQSVEYINEELRKRTGTENLLSRYGQCRELVESFLALRQNGGVDRLRALITHDLQGAVEQETRREVERRLLTLEDRLRTARQLREEETRFDPQRQAQLFQVLTTLRKLLGHIDLRSQLLEAGEALRDFFSASALRAREDLIGVFNEIYPQGNVLRGETLEHIARLFLGHARMLEERLTQLLSNDMLPEVYQRVGEEFAGTSEVAIVSCPHGVRVRWDELANLDRRDRSWRGSMQFPTFLDPDGMLFTPSAVPAQASLNGLSYREMMLDKIRLVTQQSANVLRGRVRNHLTGLEQAYREALETQDHLATTAG